MGKECDDVMDGSTVQLGGVDHGHEEAPDERAIGGLEEQSDFFVHDGPCVFKHSP